MIEPIVELYRRMSTELPQDVERALREAREREENDSPGRKAIETILENVRLARERSRPLCQDTGIPVFYVTRPLTTSEHEIKEAILSATREATRAGYLRPNAVDSVTGENSADNVGVGFPIIHIREQDVAAGARRPVAFIRADASDEEKRAFLKALNAKEELGPFAGAQESVVIEAMLKGGGCENVGMRYRLPDASLRAARDLEGVRRCVLAAVHAAQGRACPPYVVGVALGGARDSTAALAKRQLLRTLDDASPLAPLAELEAKLTDETNLLGIGPAGLGGRTTVLAVKAASEHRHPASFFVEVSFGCWAMRRARAVIAQTGVRYE